MPKIIKFYEFGYDHNVLTVQWNLGNICNYKCEYCPSILHNGTRAWVDLPLIENTIIKIQEHFPEKKIKLEFLGGEITLYKDFINLMKFCKENNFSNIIFTNASRTFRHWSEVLPYLDKILLTYHPHTTDKLHFEQVVNLLNSNNVECFVHIAMTDRYFSDTIEFGKLLYSKYNNLSISPTLMMDKENKKNFNGYFYNYNQEQIDAINLFKQSERYVAEYDNGDIQEYDLNSVKLQGLNKFKGFNCGSNKSFITIDAFGNASTSICRQKTTINIYKDNIEELFKDFICGINECKNPADIRIFKLRQI